MTSFTFVDSNIFLYADDASFPEKRALAQRALSSLQSNGSLVLSTQVMSEYSFNALRKLKMTRAQVEKRLHLMQLSRVMVTSADAIVEALEKMQRFKLSYWDALILTTAEHANCRTLLSEDFSDGQKYEKIICRNPFSELNLK